MNNGMNNGTNNWSDSRTGNRITELETGDYETTRPGTCSRTLEGGNDARIRRWNPMEPGERLTGRVELVDTARDQSTDRLVVDAHGELFEAKGLGDQFTAQLRGADLGEGDTISIKYRGGRYGRDGVPYEGFWVDVIARKIRAS